MDVLRNIAWVMGILYATIPLLWLLIHPFARHWRAFGQARMFVVLMIWISLMVITGALTYPWKQWLLYDSAWSWLGWAIFFVLGASLYSRIGHFGFNNLVGRTELEPQLDQRLIISGMHARVRHPIYISHLSMFTAWTIGSGVVVLYALWAVTLITGFLMIRAEDAELERRFGDEFREYKRRVPALFSF